MAELKLKLASALEHVLQFAPAVKRRDEQYRYFLDLIDEARAVTKNTESD